MPALVRDGTMLTSIIIGVVRKLLGLTFLGETTEQTLVVADVRMEGLSDDVRPLPDCLAVD